jgi:hypothetical protein
MWGIGTVAAWVIPIILTALFALLMATRQSADAHIEHYINKDKELRMELKDIERTVNTLDINMRRMMEAQGMVYIEPTKIHGDG